MRPLLAAYLKAEHLIKREAIIRVAVHREVGVLDGADAHRTANGLDELVGLVTPLRAEAGAHGVGRAHDRLVEQVHELDRVSRARLELFAVLAEDQAKGDVLEGRCFAGEAGLARDLEDLLEVGRLPRTHTHTHTRGIR